MRFQLRLTPLIAVAMLATASLSPASAAGQCTTAQWREISSLMKQIDANFYRFKNARSKMPAVPAGPWMLRSEGPLHGLSEIPNAQWQRHAIARLHAKYSPRFRVDQPNIAAPAGAEKPPPASMAGVPMRTRRQASEQPRELALGVESDRFRKCEIS